MASTIYLESSVVSYLVSRKSRDLVACARQRITVHWWNNRLPAFEAYISQVVLEEIGRGDSLAASRRLRAVEGFPRLRLTDTALKLAEELLRRRVVPAKFPEDAAHIGIAAAHGIDYLVTWNFAHINNAERKLGIEFAIRQAGFEPPVVCTPEELMGGGV